MGLLDQVLGNVLGSSGRSNTNSSPLMSILMALLAQRGGTGGAGGLGDLLGGLTGGGLGGNAGMNSGMSGGLGGGLGGLLEQFTRAGHGDVANSWVNSGPNQQIAPHQVEEALGGNTIDSLSRQTGMNRGDLLSELSAMLPHAVDQLTPQGRLPTGHEMKHW